MRWEELKWMWKYDTQNLLCMHKCKEFRSCSLVRYLLHDLHMCLKACCWKQMFTGSAETATILVFTNPLIKMACLGACPFKQFDIAWEQWCTSLHGMQNLKVHVACQRLKEDIASMKCATLYAAVQNNLYTFQKFMQKHIC